MGVRALGFLEERAVLVLVLGSSKALLPSLPLSLSLSLSLHMEASESESDSESDSSTKDLGFLAREGRDDMSE